MQGLFIFLFHVARHEKVWGKIKAKLPKRKVYEVTMTNIIITILSNYGCIQLFRTILRQSHLFFNRVYELDVLLLLEKQYTNWVFYLFQCTI